MLKFYLLTEVNMSLEEFMETAVNFNLYNASSKPFSDSRYDGFYAYMEGLSRFGRMILSSEYPLKIYYQEVKDGPYDRLKYYAIDSTGLSFGFIYGPIAVNINNQKSFSDKDRYYGSTEKNAHIYDCVEKMGAKSYEESIVVDLNLLRKNYLPLQKGGNSAAHCPYYDPRSQRTAGYWGPVIYKTKTRSFYLPFNELLIHTLKPDLGARNIRVYPAFKEEYISFKCSHVWETRKHDHERIWEGKISYDTFEIIEIEEVSYTSEHNW